MRLRFPWIGWVVGLTALFRVHAWDYELHRFVNELALRSLPASFPEFVRTPEAAERIAFLSGEPDRWRNSNEGAFRHVNEPDHFFDIEDLEPVGLTLDALPGFRDEFLAQFATARAKDPSRFPPIASPSDPVRVRWMPGFLPWKLAEEYGRLKSGFSTLRAFEQHGGTPSEVDNARQNIVSVMGTLGHYAGDAAQPLHTTRHYNGWVGANPAGYTTNRTFHSWIDGGFMRNAGFDRQALLARVRPARSLFSGGTNAVSSSAFPVALGFIREQFQLVVPLYEAEKAGHLKADGPQAAEGRRMLEEQLLKSGHFLGDLWLSAWVLAPKDTYLQSALARRSLDTNAPVRK